MSAYQVILVVTGVIAFAYLIASQRRSWKMQKEINRLEGRMVNAEFLQDRLTDHVVATLFSMGYLDGTRAMSLRSDRGKELRSLARQFARLDRDFVTRLAEKLKRTRYETGRVEPAYVLNFMTNLARDIEADLVEKLN